jgi:hypothetical protein
MQHKHSIVIFAACAISCSAPAQDETSETDEAAIRNRGRAETVTPSGAIDTQNPFFLPLGINGRTCGDCHTHRSGWTISASEASELFDKSDGTAPLFRPHDGAVRPDADVSTLEARRVAYATMIQKALTRFTRRPAATWEFQVVSVDDPYGFSTTTEFSNFRRPTSVSNVLRQSSPNWTADPGDVRARLMATTNGASKGHAQRPNDVPADQQAAAADFMMSLSFAQIVDKQAGRLDAAGARGGATYLAAEPFYAGINALGGDSRTAAPFDREAMTLFAAWRGLGGTPQNRARARIARGERVFNTLQFEIRDVAGLNDALGRPTVVGTCTTCHNAPNIGGHSEFRLMNTGVADAARWTRDVPLLTLRNKSTGETAHTTDLGRALNTGKWADVGKFKAPPLRGVGARAPYFHDGSAANLHEVLDFYERRFGVRFGGSRHDLIEFLQAL